MNEVRATPIHGAPNAGAPRAGTAPGTQLGQHPPAQHVIAHLSDTHFLADGRSLYGKIDTECTVVQALEQIGRSGIRLDAIVFTGDIADQGETGAYQRIRDLLAPVAERWGTQLVWVMGNHDKRGPLREILLRNPATEEPVDQLFHFNGLRVIALDTSVPGYHHGELTGDQLQWLGDQLAVPAEHGTLLVLHHPPIPTPLSAMTVLELADQHRLADVIQGSDVRGILGGHLHYSTFGTFAGVPVAVAAATCYSMDLSAGDRTLAGVNGGQSFALVHIYPDQIVSSTVPIGDFEIVTRFDPTFLTKLEQLPAEARRELFSRQVVPADTGQGQS